MLSIEYMVMLARFGAVVMDLVSTSSHLEVGVDVFYLDALEPCRDPSPDPDPTPIRTT